jgi:hypothetical protein
MKTKGLLIISKTGSIRAVKSIRGNIDSDEVVVALNIEIPDSAFKPVIQADIKIEEKDVRPFLIKAGKLNQMKELIQDEIGLDVVLRNVIPHLKKT